MHKIIKRLLYFINMHEFDIYHATRKSDLGDIKLKELMTDEYIKIWRNRCQQYIKYNYD